MAHSIQTSAPATAGAATKQPTARTGRTKSTYPYWFLVPGGLIFALFFLVPSGDRVLLQPHPVDAVRPGVHRARQLPAVLRRAGARLRPHAHAHLRGGDLRAEGGPRDGARRPPHRADHRAGLHALGRLLPGPGEHDRHRPDVPGAHAPDRGRDQPGARRRRHLRPGLAGRPAMGAALRRVRRRLAGRGAGHRDLHGRHPVHPGRVLRGGEVRRSQRVAALPQHHAPARHARDVSVDHPVAHRRTAEVRPDLGDDQGRPGLHLRRDGVGRLQAVPGRLLRAVDRGQRRVVPARRRRSCCRCSGSSTGRMAAS